MKKKIQIIVGNSNSKFSGVTSTMLQTIPYINDNIKLAVLGKSFVPKKFKVINFYDFLKLTLKTDTPVLFHARRNSEMLLALISKWLGGNIKIVFTSTAQRYHTKFTKFLINQMDGIIATSDRAARFIHKKADAIIPHGVDLDRYHPAQDKHDAWINLGFPGRFGIGIFGRVRPQKGIHLLVETVIPLLKKHTDACVIIVGKTTARYMPYRDKLKLLVSKAGLSDRILFLGEKDFGELPEYFRATSIITALSENEGFGLTVLEAMASGTAVIATKAGAWPNIITDHRDGILIPVGNAELLCRSLSFCLENRKAVESMGQNGRKKALQEHSILKESRSLLSYYLNQLKLVP